MCGIIGVIGHAQATDQVYHSLLLLQHRGQDAAGIVAFDSNTQCYNYHKSLGRVEQVFTPQILGQLKGDCVIGHTRYATTGGDTERDVQPITLGHPFGLALAHNGNIINNQEMKKELRSHHQRYTFSDNDGETLANLLAEKLDHHCRPFDGAFNKEALFAALSELLRHIQGAYSIIGSIAGEGLFALRDPQGIRPLVLGGANGHYALASESNVLDFYDLPILEAPRPGEAIFIDLQGELTRKQLTEKQARPCMFEWVYFSHPESEIKGQSIYSKRLQLGRELGEQILQKEKTELPDVVVPVPETSRVAAITLAETLKLPFRELLIKNRYVQRSFILNGQDKRQMAIRLKLAAVKGELEDKHVLLVDDSIVRGNTAMQLVKLVQQAGASRVSFAITCPPLKHPCFLGIDFPTPEELSFNRYGGAQEQTKAFHAHRMHYLDTQRLKKVLGSDICTGCLDKNYPMSEYLAQEFLTQRRKERT